MKMIKIFLLFTLVLLNDCIEIITQPLIKSVTSYSIEMLIGESFKTWELEIDMTIDFLWISLYQEQKEFFFTQTKEQKMITVNNKSSEGILCYSDFTLGFEEITLENLPFYFINKGNKFNSLQSIPLAYKFDNESFSIVHHLYQKNLIHKKLLISTIISIRE